MKSVGVRVRAYISTTNDRSNQMTRRCQEIMTLGSGHLLIMYTVELADLAGVKTDVIFNYKSWRTLRCCDEMIFRRSSPRSLCDSRRCNKRKN